MVHGGLKVLRSNLKPVNVAAVDQGRKLSQPAIGYLEFQLNHAHSKVPSPTPTSPPLSNLI